ncbi:MAG: hypothetical protein ACRDFB_03700 [Rhabdochlamydiaceae bacterium]
MADIAGLQGLSTPSVNTLVAAYGNDMVNLTTGKGYGVNLTPGYDVQFDTLLGSLFFQNSVDPMRSFNGTIWSNKHCLRPPLGALIKVWRSRQRMYVGKPTIQGTNYPSRIWYCDFPNNDTIQWGFEYGNNLQTYANSPTIASANAGFKTYGIKVGDPLFILTGKDIGQYTVLSVDADQQITLTDPLTTTDTTIQYWAGGNYFDIGPDDGDYLQWMEENNDFLMCFKRDSLYKINQSDGSSITKIRGAFGTTSGRSVQNLHEITIYWYQGVGLATGFYAFNGLYSQKISAPIDNHIHAMTNQSLAPVAWREGELYRCFIGDLFDSTYDINLTNAVATWDYTTKTWSIDPIDNVPIVASEFRQDILKYAYFGTNTNQVMVTPKGSTYNGKPTPFSVSLSTIYPAGPANVCVFTRLQVISHDMHGTQIQYRLHLKPFDTDEEFRDLGQITRERTEFRFLLRNAQASGIEFRLLGLDGQPLEGRIDKMMLFYKPKSDVISG